MNTTDEQLLEALKRALIYAERRGYMRALRDEGVEPETRHEDSMNASEYPYAFATYENGYAIIPPAPATRED